MLSMKEMCCCVCLKEEAFENNPIISCDGRSCNTIVHKNCYGIHQIPDGAWFCQKCISQERSARVRCELCPSREGALKHTNKGGWCHIVCALFIPGVEFQDWERLETICIDKVASDKMNKMCSICERNNRLDRASLGACIQCARSGCKTLFHVTCAQISGLLTSTGTTTHSATQHKSDKYLAFCPLHKHKTRHREFTMRSPVAPSKTRVLGSRGETSRNSSEAVTVVVPSSASISSPPLLEKSDDSVTTAEGGRTSSSGCTGEEGLEPSNAMAASSSTQLSSISGSSAGDTLPPQTSMTTDTGAEFTCSQLTDPASVADAECPEQEEDDIAPPEIVNTSNIRVLSCSGDEQRRDCEPVLVRGGNSSCDSSIHTVNTAVDTPPIPPSCAPGGLPTASVKKEKKSEQISPVNNTKPIKRPRKITTAKSNSGSNTTTTKKAKRATSKAIKSEPTASQTQHTTYKLPPRPKSLMDHLILTTSTQQTHPPPLPSTTSEPQLLSTDNPPTSLEQLLEWQWDQTSSLLMQQAQASTSDIASLLSCLHQLKSQNDTLLSKQLKLIQRRDHLKAVNAKLQLQLTSRQQPSAPPQSQQKTNNVVSNSGPAIVNNIIRPTTSSTKQVNGPNLGRPATTTVCVVPSTNTTNNISLALSQTDLVTFLNQQLQSQLQQQQQPPSTTQSQQQPTVSNMELLYQAIQQKKIQQQQRVAASTSCVVPQTQTSTFLQQLNPTTPSPIHFTAQISTPNHLTTMPTTQIQQQYSQPLQPHQQQQPTTYLHKLVQYSTNPSTSSTQDSLLPSSNYTTQRYANKRQRQGDAPIPSLIQQIRSAGDKPACVISTFDHQNPSEMPTQSSINTNNTTTINQYLSNIDHPSITPN